MDEQRPGFTLTNTMLKVMLENVNQPLSISDGNDIIVFINKAMCQLYGYEEHELIGKHASILRPESFEESISSRILAESRTNSGFNEVIFNVKKDGTLFPIRLSTTIITDPATGTSAYAGVVTDVSEEWSIKKNYTLQEEYYQTLWEYSADAMRVTDKDGYILKVNRAFEELFQIKREAILHKPLSALFSDEVGDEPDRVYRDRYSKRKILSEFEAVIHLKNGNSLRVQVRNTFINMPYSGEVLLSIFRDISVLMEAQEKIRRQEDLFRILIQYSNDGIFLINAAGELQYASPAAELLLGNKSRSGTSGRRPIESVFHEDLKVVQSKFESILTSPGSTERLEFRILDDNDQIRWTEAIATNCLHIENVHAIVVNARDITERKKAEEQMQLYSEAFAQSPISILILNNLGVIKYANRGTELASGYSADELIGNTLALFDPDETSRTEYVELWASISSGKIWKGELLSRKKNGTPYWEQVSCFPIVNPDTRMHHHIAIKVDITERKELELALHESVKKAENSSKLKSTLLENMSHEFRTPMNGILGFTSVLLSELESPSLREMAEKIQISGRRLMNTLSTLLDYSEISSESIVATPENVPLADLLRNLYYDYTEIAKSRGLSFHVEVPEHEITLLSDQMLIHKVLNILLDNAFKFTDTGKVEVSVLEDKIKSFDPRVAICVKDTGIGIREENYNVIFEEFRQLSTGKKRLYEGSGLGLSVASKFISMMGGSIRVESVYGEGSSFIIELPILPVAGGQALTVTPLNLSANPQGLGLKRKSLIVEDNEINREITAIYVEQFCQIDYAETGEEALEMCQRDQYEILFVDIHLGAGMDGTELLKKIRMMPNYSDTPVVAITGYAMYGDRSEFLKKGFNAYIPKPFKREDIEETVKKLLTLP